MQIVCSSTATANGAGEFTQGQPGSGIDATRITVAWLNAIQRELVNLVQDSGQELKPEDDKQVLKAVKALQELASAWEKITGKPTTRDGYKLSDVHTKTEVGTAIQSAVSGLMPKAGGALYPKFSGLSFNAESGGYDAIGGYIGWGSNGSGTVQFICNKGGGSVGGFLWAHSDAAGNLTNPMRYTPDGRLAIATELFVPAIVSNTLVNTQGIGYSGKYIASCEFVNNAVGGKVGGDRCVLMGFYSGVTTAPFMLHSDGTVVYLQTNRPKDTALLAPNGWSKNADTGEIKQWVEVVVDDISSTKTLSVSWPFQFPNKFLNAQITFKIPSSTGWCTAVGTYYDANTSGCTLRVEEWASVLQTGLIAVVEARGN